MDVNINWMNLLSNFPLNLRGPFCTSTLTSKFYIAFLIIHTREKLYLSLMYTMCANPSNDTPSYNSGGGLFIGNPI